MERWHCACFDTTNKTVTKNKIISSFELFNEAIKCYEIIAIVGIADDHEFAACCFDSRFQCIPIATLGSGHDSCAKRFGDLLRAISAAIVSDDNLSREALSRQIALRLCNAIPKRLCLI